MRLITRVGVTVALGAFLGFVPSTVEAVTIVPGDAICTANFGDFQQQKDSSFLNFCGISDVDLLYKAEVEGGESGPFAGSYSTLFDNDAESGTITYDGAPDPTISCPTCYAVVKDGNHTPGWYLFNLGNWNGTDSLTFEGFWPDNGAISHISIYGGEGGGGGGAGGDVPEPASLSLLGLGMLGAAYRARKRRALVG